MSDKYQKTIIDLAKKATKKNEVPVGCVIVYNGRIIAKSYNRREKCNDILKHAEIIAIKKAAKKLKTWKLNDCDMYVALKPCEMCDIIIKQSRIKKVYYLADKLEYKKEYNKTVYEKIGDDQEYLKILKNFFENKRKK